MQGWAVIRVNFDPIQEIEPVCVCVCGGGGGGGGGPCGTCTVYLYCHTVANRVLSCSV